MQTRHLYISNLMIFSYHMQKYKLWSIYVLNSRNYIKLSLFQF